MLTRSLSTCRSELKVASLKVPRSQLRGRDEEYVGGSSNVGCRKTTKKRKIRRWKKQIFERKITVTAAQSLDVEKTE